MIDWQDAPLAWLKASRHMGARMRNRGPAGGESGGGWVVVRAEDQMRSLVSITADLDSPVKKENLYPARGQAQLASRGGLYGGNSVGSEQGGIS